MWKRHRLGDSVPRTPVMKALKESCESDISSIAAGTLIVREPSRRNSRPSSAENSGGCACSCAVPYEFGKEHTPTKRLDVYWKSGQDVRPLYSDDSPNCATPLGDRRHFVDGHQQIP